MLDKVRPAENKGMYLNETIVEPAEEMVVSVLSRCRTIIRGKENTDAFVDLGEVMYSSTEGTGK